MHKKNRNVILIIWIMIIVAIVFLLFAIGIRVKKNHNGYTEVEEKLLKSAKQYVDHEFLYPDEGETLKVTSDELIENGFLDDLTYKKDTCTGYVTVTYKNVYNYEAYIKCSDYKTTGYKK